MVAAIAAAALAAEGYHVTGKIKIGGAGRWDYCYMDNANRRLYVSHGAQTDVVDVDAGKVVGTIPDTPGVHGIAVADDLGKGFTSNGQGNNVTAFDLKTLQKVGEAKTGGNPDAICYEPKTHRVLTFNGGNSHSATVIDAKTMEVVGTLEVGGKPEFCATAGGGKMYDNIEDTSEVIEVDVAKPAVTRRTKIDPCDEPSGLAIDGKDGVLFSVCGNKTMAVTDIKSFKVIATPAIGQGPDAAGFDAGLGLAFSSNGQDGTLTVVKKVDGKWQPVETAQTERGARTMAVDAKEHKIYLLAAEYAAPATQPQGEQKKGGRPQAIPDSFHVLVVSK
jgi:DNA-binding beta-propeller fold protein YncE